MENNQPVFENNVPNDSEMLGSIPNHSDVFRIVPQSSERTENHTLTVREVARMFEAASVARTERSITNWCQPNKLGMSRLDAYFDPNERKYFLTPESVERAIAEEVAKTTKAPKPSETFGTIPNDAERSSERRQSSVVAESERALEVERELRDLRITNHAKDLFIDQLKQEREFFAKERQGYVEQLMSFNRKLGELETKLLQIAPPKNASSDDVQEIR